MVCLYFCLQPTSGLPLFFLSGYLYYYLYVNLINSDIILICSFVKGLINILSIGYVIYRRNWWQLRIFNSSFVTRSTFRDLRQRTACVVLEGISFPRLPSYLPFDISLTCIRSLSQSGLIWNQDRRLRHPPVGLRLIITIFQVSITVSLYSYTCIVYLYTNYLILI